MRTIAFALSILLAGVSAHSIDVKNKGADMSEPDTYNADSLLAEADSLFQKQDYTGALEKYVQTAETARKEFNRPVETEALAQIARVNLATGNKEEGRKLLAVAAQRASDSDPLGWSRYLSVKGRFEWKDDSLPKARETFNEMYVYCNTNGLWSRAVDAANMLAIVAETPEEQISWSKQGIQTAEAGDAEHWLGPLWNNLGAVYYEGKQFDLALDAFLRAREYHWHYSTESAKLFADYHVGMAYRAVGQYDLAGQWLRPVLAWAERLGNHAAIAQACEDLGEIAAATGKNGEALALLRRARDEYKTAGYEQSSPEIWDNINRRVKELSK